MICLKASHKRTVTRSWNLWVVTIRWTLRQMQFLRSSFLLLKYKIGMTSGGILIQYKRKGKEGKNAIPVFSNWVPLVYTVYYRFLPQLGLTWCLLNRLRFTNRAPAPNRLRSAYQNSGSKLWKTFLFCPLLGRAYAMTYSYETLVFAYARMLA